MKRKPYWAFRLGRILRSADVDLQSELSVFQKLPHGIGFAQFGQLEFRDQSNCNYFRLSKRSQGADYTSVNNFIAEAALETLPETLE